MKITQVEKPQQYIDYLEDIISKVKYMDYKFKFDRISWPTQKQVDDLNDPTSMYQHRLSINILHYGPDSEKEDKTDMSWLTYCGHVMITEWTEEAIKKAIYITLIQKFRHEVSEVFSYDGVCCFHEHKTDNVEIPQ